MSDRTALIRNFLTDTAWQDWMRTPLAGDASARRYHRLSSHGQSAILMDAPPENGEDTVPFVEIATLLRKAGFAAPDVLLHDAKNGLLLLSDLGTTDYAQWLRQTPTDEGTLYQSATTVLLKLEELTPPPHLTHLTPPVGAQMIEIVGTHYTHTPVTDLCSEVKKSLEEFAPEPTVLALRDYHAENLIWRAEKTGIAQVGLLDFQDAFVAPPGYDLASLLRDARRDVSPSVVEEMITYFGAHTKATTPFRTSLACLGVQRNLRILGVFARLVSTLNKPRYAAFMPRVWAHITADLQDPALATLRQAVMDQVPEPTATRLAGRAT
ncbi:aminoglycoside phosphotransferase family protein [Yoonia sp.]|uniref:aminoglycoside phosphotransferase family protein n=1 Tax=Yoonia sp. TaxID=2212373 RepID=UPI002DFF64D2|nr:phosphotransferase [Yoonia sp.]